MTLTICEPSEKRKLLQIHTYRLFIVIPIVVFKTGFELKLCPRPATGRGQLSLQLPL